MRNNGFWFKGTLDSIFQNLNLINNYDTYVF